MHHMAEKNKVVKMKINVDLECSKCYKKIKKVLCGFHEIGDQVYDEKANTVTITTAVDCCSPEKMKEKIWCKAGNTILAIQTLIPEKPNPKDEHKPPPQPICSSVYPGYPVPVCAWGWGCPCSQAQGYGGGPYYARLPPPMCSDRCGRPAYACQGPAYFTDENPSASCMLM